VASCGDSIAGKLIKTTLLEEILCFISDVYNDALSYFVLMRKQLSNYCVIACLVFVTNCIDIKHVGF
jgi:hypothetical protein